MTVERAAGKRLAILAASIMFVTMSSLPLVLPTAQAAPPTLNGVQGTTRVIARGAPTTFHPTQTGMSPNVAGNERRTDLGPDRYGTRTGANRAGGAARRSSSPAARRGASSAAEVADGSIVRTGARLATSFRALNHYEQRTANGGNQQSVEPPSPALCVGNGHVVEAVNEALRVYDQHGSPQTGVEDLNTFFGYPAAIDRTTGVAGPEVNDPSCLFDPVTRQFFLTVLTLAVDSPGQTTGQNQLDIAVTRDPTRTWTLYHLDVTDDGSNGTPVHPHCPCVGDYAHLGVDAHGLYISTNEYSFFGPQFNGAQIYAFSKRALASHADPVYVTQYDTAGAVDGDPGFTVWPAQSPTVGQYARGNNGTEYFLSANAAEEANGNGSSRQIIVWALTGTATVGTADPTTALVNRPVAVDQYSTPPLSNQKSGPTPLRDCLNQDACATSLGGQPDPYTEVLSPLDSNYTRMQQVTYARGKLYGALGTAVSLGGSTLAGIAYYVIQPSAAGRRVSGSVVLQGQFGLADNNLTYPEIGVASSGHAVISFTLVGADYYPSAAFASFDATNGPGPIQLAAAGAGPQDGLTNYAYYFGGQVRPRWGDYGATASAGTRVWVVSEYIAQRCALKLYKRAPFGTCNGTRTSLANWATRVSLIEP